MSESHQDSHMQIFRSKSMTYDDHAEQFDPPVVAEAVCDVDHRAAPYLGPQPGEDDPATFSGPLAAPRTPAEEDDFDDDDDYYDAWFGGDDDSWLDDYDDDDEDDDDDDEDDDYDEEEC